MAHPKQKLSLQAKAKVRRWDDRMLDGHPGVVTPAVKRFIMRAVAAGGVCTSTYPRGTPPNSFSCPPHVNGSNHCKAYPGTNKRRAADVGWYMSGIGRWRMHRFYRREFRRERKKGAQWLELYGPGAHYIQGGQVHSGQFPGHTDHVHGAPMGFK